MILVVGATGLVGSAVCERLIAEGKQVGALVRSSADAAKVNKLEALGIKLVPGDLRQPQSLEAACRGVEQVIMTASAMPFTYQPGVNDIQTTDLGGARNLVAAAKKGGVKHFVYTSVSPNLQIDFPLLSAKRAVENELKQSGMTYTILRPSCFTEVWLSPAVGFDPANAKATIYGTGREPVSYISYRDVAEFAVQSLAAPAAANATLDLGGPQAISQLEAVDIFERAAHRKFELQFVPDEALAAQQAAAEDPMQQSFAALMRSVGRGDAIDMRNTLKLVPIELTSVKAYAAGLLKPA
jgi:NADH dehydrogenase